MEGGLGRRRETAKPTKNENIQGDRRTLRTNKGNGESSKKSSSTKRYQTAIEKTKEQRNARLNNKRREKEQCGWKKTRSTRGIDH